MATQKYWNSLSAQFHERQGTAETGSCLAQSGASALSGGDMSASAPPGGDSVLQFPRFPSLHVFFINKVCSVKYSIVCNQSLTVQQESQHPIRWQQLRPDWSVLVFKSQPSSQTQLPPPPQYLHLVPI